MKKAIDQLVAHVRSHSSHDREGHSQHGAHHITHDDAHGILRQSLFLAVEKDKTSMINTLVAGYEDLNIAVDASHSDFQDALLRSIEYGSWKTFKKMKNHRDSLPVSDHIRYMDLISMLKASIRCGHAHLVEEELHGMHTHGVSFYQKYRDLRDALFLSVLSGHDRIVGLIAEEFRRCEVDILLKHEVFRHAIRNSSQDKHNVVSALTSATLSTFGAKLKKDSSPTIRNKIVSSLAYAAAFSSESPAFLKAEIYYQALTKMRTNLGSDEELRNHIMVPMFQGNAQELPSKSDGPNLFRQDHHSIKTMLHHFQKQYLGSEQHLFALLGNSYRDEGHSIVTLIHNYTEAESDISQKQGALRAALEAYAGEDQTGAVRQIACAFRNMCDDDMKIRACFSHAMRFSKFDSATHNYLESEYLKHRDWKDWYMDFRSVKDERTEVIQQIEYNSEILPDSCKHSKKGFTHKQVIIKLPCSHTFCPICLSLHMDKHFSCPICHRRLVKSSSLNHIPSTIDIFSDYAKAIRMQVYESNAHRTLRISATECAGRPFWTRSFHQLDPISSPLT